MRPTFIAVLISAAFSVPMIVPVQRADAASYDVHACDASAASAANNSFAAYADGGLTAYSDCPAGQGMTVRNVWDNGQTSAFQGATLIFDAPPGTFVDSISFEAGVQRHSCTYATAIVAGNADLGGRIAWGLPANQQCDSWQTPGTTAFLPSRWENVLIGATRVRLDTRCGAASCPRDGVAALRLRNVVVHVTDNTAPQVINPRGSLWTTAGWLSGVQAVGFDASDGAGIREASVQIDGREVARSTNGCDYTLRAPCPMASMDQPLATAGFGSDGLHTLTLLATDAAGNPSSIARTIKIDNSPPDAPTGIALAGGDSWRQANSFDLTWTNPAFGTGAPVAGAAWDLCPADGGPCLRGAHDGANISSMSGLAVPGPGAWTMKLWLRDAAGNQDPRLAGPPVTLRYDETSPEVSLLPLSADDPTLIRATAADQGSGLAGGQIEIRRAGGARWKPVSTQLDSAGFAGRLDDEHLADGTYELRATASDVAGNARETGVFANGTSARVNLPLRLKTTLHAGVVRRSRGHLKLVRAAYASYGRLVEVRGRLATPEGNPMQSVTVQAYTQVRDGKSLPRLIATVTTTRTGAFHFLVRKGPSRTIRIRYGGAAQVRSATKRIVLYVRSKTTIRPDRHSLVNGDTVRFSGRVTTGRIPVEGKLIALEVLTRGRWRTFATTRANRRGAWKYDYRFDGTVGSQNYRFRAAIPRESNYPFAAGGSSVVRVHVKGV